MEVQKKTQAYKNLLYEKKVAFEIRKERYDLFSKRLEQLDNHLKKNAILFLHILY